MVHFFTVGPHQIRCELHAMTPTGPYRLAVHHPGGPLIEYFDNAIAALVRQGEIEEVLLAERAQTDHGITMAISSRTGSA